MPTNSLLLLLIGCGGGSAEFDIRVVDGRPQTGAIKAIAADGQITMAGQRTIAGSDWYAWRRAGVAGPALVRDPHVELVNGDRMRCQVLECDGDMLRVRLALSGPDRIMRFPLSAVRSVWFTRRPERDPEWLDGPRKRDIVRARSGDQFAGALTQISASRNLIVLQSAGKDEKHELAKIAAIACNTDLARDRRPKGPYYRLLFHDGSRLSVTGLEVNGDNWTVQTPFKESIKLPADEVVGCDVEQGRAIWLASLTPVKYAYQSTEGEQISWSANRSAGGGPMRLAADSAYDRGLGLHAECAITYALGGKYRRFEALVGLDAGDGHRGDVVIAIAVDGKERELPNSGRLGAVMALSLDVADGKELTISVRRGKGGNVRDAVNFVEARLLP